MAECLVEIKPQRMIDKKTYVKNLEVRKQMIITVTLVWLVKIKIFFSTITTVSKEKISLFDKYNGLLKIEIDQYIDSDSIYDPFLLQ